MEKTGRRTRPVNYVRDTHEIQNLKQTCTIMTNIINLNTTILQAPQAHPTSTSPSPGFPVSENLREMYENKNSFFNRSSPSRPRSDARYLQ